MSSRSLREKRRELASENRFLKYSRYAIGEVVLLVCGVLIALQINVWNEERKNDNVRIGILENLMEEFELNREEIDKSIETTEGIIESAKLLLKMMGPDYLKFDRALVDSLLSETLQTPAFVPVNGAISDVLHSGKMNYIKSDSIRSYLVSWEADLNYAVESDKSAERILANIVFPYLYDKISLRNIDNAYTAGFEDISHSPFNVDNRELLNKLAFENMIDDHLYRVFEMQDAYYYIMDDLNEIQRLIQKSLPNEQNNLEIEIETDSVN